MRVLSCSDTHLCHRRTPTVHTLKAMSRFFYKDVDLDTIDLILFTGDVFDRYVDNDNPDFLLTLAWFKVFFKVCKDKNVIVRFVEGTTLHDWGQPQHLMFSVEEGTDVKYYDHVTIETFEKLGGLTIMYVPDNMSDKTPDEIWEQALTTLNTHELSKVDLIALHGGFHFQLPEKGRKHAHMEERWKTIVKYGIFSGHIHTPCEWENTIFSNGSFDRLSHGEEHAKGAWIIDLDLEREKLSTRFWENKHALPYRTIKVGLDDLPEHVVLTVKRYLSSERFPNHSWFRLKGGNKSVIGPIVSGLQKEYPHFSFKEDSENDEVLVESELYEKSDYVGVSIVDANIFSFLEPIVMPKFEGTGITAEEVNDVLREFT